MCSKLGTLSQSSAVFVVRVVEIWPARDVLLTHQHLSRSYLRRLIVQRWRSALSADEERYIRTSPEWGKIESHYAYMQRIRFAVSETSQGRRFTRSTRTYQSADIDSNQAPELDSDKNRLSGNLPA